MLLKSTRNLREMVSVLASPVPENCNLDDPVYWVFSGVSKSWENMTVISPGSYSGEFPKTFGHYHTSNITERYKLITGQGLLLMQKRKFADDDWIIDQLERLYLVELIPGDEIDITPEWGHSWSNIGNEPLITLDNWKEGHTPGDYEPIEKMGGMGYFLVKSPNGAEYKPNPKYKDVPRPEWITAGDFKKLNTL